MNKTERWKTDDDLHKNSLRLLPSGSDRVREVSIHHQPSALYIPQMEEFRKDFGKLFY